MKKRHKRVQQKDFSILLKGHGTKNSKHFGKRYLCLYREKEVASYKTHPIHQSILVLEGRKSI